MKQKIRISVGLCHFVCALVLFTWPALSREFTATGVLGPVVGILMILSSSFARYELGVVKLLAYREHLYAIAGLMTLLFTAATYCEDRATRAAWIAVALVAMASVAWSLRAHHVRRRVVFGE